MRFYLLAIVMVAMVSAGCVGGNGHQRDMGPGSYDDPPAESIIRPRPPPKRKRPPYRPPPAEPPEDDCQAHQTACLASPLGRKRGGLYGRKVCLDCADRCVAEGRWPDWTYDGKRCDWWSYTKGTIAELP